MPGEEMKIVSENQFECSNCFRKFETVAAFEAHKGGCTKIYRCKPHYKKIFVTRFLINSKVKGENDVPKRFSVPVRNALFSQISEREGSWCIHCGYWPARDGPETSENELEIHHADNDIHNWEVENLHILCNKCNLEFRKYPVDVQIKMIKTDCDRNMYVAQERKMISNTELLRKSIDCTDARPELKITSLCEVKFRTFALREVDRVGALTREQLTDAGAEEAGCTIDTTAKYLRKLTSYRGPLESHKTESGTIITRRKSVKQ